MFYLHPLDISEKYPKNVPKRPLFWYGKGHKENQPKSIEPFIFE